MQQPQPGEEPHGLNPSVPALGVHGMWMGKWWFDNLRKHSRARGIDLRSFDLPEHGELYTSAWRVRWISLKRYVDALHMQIQRYETPPILIGHSLGCLLIEAVLSRLSQPPPGIVLIAPTGHEVFRHSVWDFARRHPWRFLQLILTCSMWPPVSTIELAREMLFPVGMSDREVGKHHERMHGDSYLSAVQLLTGLGPQPSRVPGVPVLVIGGDKDKAVRPADVKKVAAFHGASIHWFDLPHNMMLVPGWENVAATIEDWALQLGQLGQPPVVRGA